MKVIINKKKHKGQESGHMGLEQHTFGFWLNLLAACTEVGPPHFLTFHYALLLTSIIIIKNLKISIFV